MNKSWFKGVYTTIFHQMKIIIFNYLKYKISYLRNYKNIYNSKLYRLKTSISSFFIIFNIIITYL